jgi:hypothetical protein
VPFIPAKIVGPVISIEINADVILSIVARFDFIRGLIFS